MWLLPWLLLPTSYPWHEAAQPSKVVVVLAAAPVRRITEVCAPSVLYDRPRDHCWPWGPVGPGRPSRRPVVPRSPRRMRGPRRKEALRGSPCMGRPRSRQLPPSSRSRRLRWGERRNGCGSPRSRAWTLVENEPWRPASTLRASPAVL